MREPVKTVANASHPVTLDECKQHANVYIDDDNEYISKTLIPAATQYAESLLDRSLMPVTWRLDLDGFPPSSESIELPRPPLRAITEITYVDTAGDTQTWLAANYTTTIGGEGEFGRVRPAFGISYPVTRAHVDVVSITYTAGFADVASIPELTRWGIKVLVAHWYEMREPIAPGSIVASVPMHIENAFALGPAGRMASVV